MAVALWVPSLLQAQSQDAPKEEVFIGYSWYHAGGTVPSTVVRNAIFPGAEIPDFEKGGAAQGTYNVNRWAGFAVDMAGHSGKFGNAYSLAAGPQLKWRNEGITPFAEALVGWQRLGPQHYPDHDGPALFLGGGMDLAVTPRISIRAFQVDYVLSNYKPLEGSSNKLNGVRLQAGLVFKFGLPPAEGKVSAACSADPQAVDAGTAVKIVVTPSGFMARRTLTYSYASTGGTIGGNTMSGSVDTTGLAPGSYTVTAKVVDSGRGSHQQMASCQTGFSVNRPAPPPQHPPALTVSADPASVKSGDASTITANGSSPDNRPLSYFCSATAGRLSGSGRSYTLDTAGVPDSTVTVNCTVTDDRSLTATAHTQVRVSAVQAAAKATDFGAIEFKHDLKRPTRVDNEAKGELDRYADALNAAPDSKGVVVGYETATEPKAFAAERAVNTKDYLTKEKGIDPARIEPRTGSGDDQKTELWIVPADAFFPAEGTKAVDESRVKAIPRAAAPAVKKARKKVRE
jgi:outer membrane protein OmpA-like peptidoglycan-associated protein